MTARAERQRARQSANAEKLREQSRVRYAADPARGRARQAAYRARHPDRAAEKQRAKNAAWQSGIDAIKSHPCTDCGGTFPPECMDFDHVRGEKVATINQIKSVTSARFREELAKCELVCSNCHRIRTRKRIRGNLTHAEL